MNPVFGAIGFAGGAAVMTAVLILGARGGWKIKLGHEAVIVVAFITGQMYAQAGENFAFVSDMSGGLSEMIQSSIGTGANFGAGAVALLMTVIVFGCKPNKLRNSVLTLMLPAMYTAAGAKFAMLTNIISDLTGTVVA